MRLPPLAKTVAVLLLVTSCANPINQKTASNYYDAGLQASDRGDHYQAAALYSRAWGNASIGRSPKDAISMTLYAYGRELALLGEFDEAVLKLQESLQLQRRIKPKTTPEILRRLSVLGRVYLDTGRAEEALPLLQEAAELTTPPEGIELPPADRIYLLHDLESAVALAGTPRDLAAVSGELEELRAVHGNIQPTTAYERFTPDAVAERLRADRSPAPFKPRSAHADE